MGWKNVKEGYQIEHAVCVTEEGLCIGSPYIHNIIVIGKDGFLKKRYESGFGTNEDLFRYQREMDADPNKLRELVMSQDSFAASNAVYTYEGGKIIEKKCEKLGWPNVTHDGDMMYENTFSTDKSKVVKWAKRNADAGIEMFQRRIDEMRKELAEMENLLATTKLDREKLEGDYPHNL